MCWLALRAHALAGINQFVTVLFCMREVGTHTGVGDQQAQQEAVMVQYSLQEQSRREARS